MSEKEPNTGFKGGSDLEKVRKHDIGADEYDEAPELTDAQLDAAIIREGERVVRRGRR